MCVHLTKSFVNVIKCTYHLDTSFQLSHKAMLRPSEQNVQCGTIEEAETRRRLVFHPLQVCNLLPFRGEREALEYFDNHRKHLDLLLQLYG